MEKQASKEHALETKLRELEMVCRVWIAASNVKDERIEELEQEVEHLQQRIARLSRLVERRQKVERRSASSAR